MVFKYPSGQIKMSDQIWKLDAEQAREILHEFLRAERAAFQSLRISSIELNYSPESVIQVAHYIANEIQAGNLGEEQQSIWFARLGFYLGEALCHAKPGLSWGIGDSEYAFANHPVIKGFSGDEEAPTITICKSMILAVVEGLSPPIRIDNGVMNWFNKVVVANP